MLTFTTSTPAGSKPGSIAGQLLARADHQSRTDEQHDRHRDFRDHERRAQPLRAHAAGAARGLLQGVREPRHPRVQRGRQPEKHAADERHADRERQRGQIQCGLDERRELDRAGRWQHTEDRPGEAQAGGRAQEREHAALDHELTKQPRRPCAERRAHRDLLLTRLRPADQQVRDVGAGDQEHEDHRGHQRRHDRLELAEQLDRQRTHLDGALLVGRGIRRFELSRDHVHLGAGLGDRRARLQSGERLESAVPRSSGAKPDSENGTHSCALSVRPVNPGGMMPTTVYAWPLS